MSNQDKKMINACTRDEVKQLFGGFCQEHPMDENIIQALAQLGDKIRDGDDDYEIFRYRKETDDLWVLLLEKAIKCLRYYDNREPFLESGGGKRPKAYGIDDLKDYYKKYTQFEEILYGSSRFYRDHVIHVLRTWLSGVELLVKNNGKALDNIKIHDKRIPLELNRAEKISIWTIIALTHDLGYPLEKAKGIIGVTQNMLSSFIANPDVSADFAFHGVQNYMNDFVVRLMSSKMEERKKPDYLSEGKEEKDKEEKDKEKKDKEEKDKEEKDKERYYVARLQSKYYFKFQKSLERNGHGILSALIIYKLLTYFLESDYNLNEDYYFDEEDCRQFYIRREILRAISSHTCDDIYQMYMGSFAFLLRICDDTQEWGRKNISELYVKSGQNRELQDIDLSFDDGTEQKLNCCTIKEQITVPDKDNTINLIRRFRDQAMTYVTIFRDGQDTISRDFSFIHCLTIKTGDISVELRLEIDKEKASKLCGVVSFTSDENKNKPFGSDFCEELAEKLKSKCDYKIFDSKGNPADENNASAWRTGKLDVLLIN